MTRVNPKWIWTLILSEMCKKMYLVFSINGLSLLYLCVRVFIVGVRLYLAYVMFLIQCPADAHCIDQH